VRGQQIKTVVTTVVQVQTVAPPPPATKHLTAIVTGPNGSCLSADTAHTGEDGHTFTLRGESNGLNDGTLFAIADNLAMDGSGCDLDIHFSLSPNLGFFYVHDDTSTVTWGPFDSHKLRSYGYLLRLNFST